MDKILTKQDKLNIPFQVKSNLSTYKEIDEGQRTIKAVVNTYNYFDYDYDVLRVGCAKKSIQERGSNSQAPDKILHALFHDLRQLPGKSMNEKETEVNGNFVIYAESKLSESSDGEDTLIKYKDGIYNQHSIGFNYMQIEFVEKESEGWDNYIRDLINPEDAENAGFGWDVKEIKLHEWSTVALGANRLTPYLGVKTQNKKILLENVFAKLKALVEKSKRLEVKNKKIFELQYKQLQQMIYELTTIEPAKKDISVQRLSGNAIQSDINYNYLLNKL
jgi:hypothetical protein